MIISCNECDSSFSADDLNVHHVVIPISVAAGGTLEFFIDGKAAGSSGEALSPTPLTATTFNVVSACGTRRTSSLGFSSKFDVALNGLILGKLSSSEAGTLSENLWQLYEPLPRRIWVPSVAAASGRIMSSLTRHGGLAGSGGIAGHGGGLAG